MKRPGACPEPRCIRAAGHTDACMAFGGEGAVPLEQAPRDPDVVIAELRAELELERRVRRRLVGALREVQRVNVGAVLEAAEAEWRDR